MKIKVWVWSPGIKSLSITYRPLIFQAAGYWNGRGGKIHDQVQLEPVSLIISNKYCVFITPLTALSKRGRKGCIGGISGIFKEFRKTIYFYLILQPFFASLGSLSMYPLENSPIDGSWFVSSRGPKSFEEEKKSIYFEGKTQ